MRQMLQKYMQLESSGGIVLLLSAVAALVLVNSPLAALYHQSVHLALFWINEGLMAIFFLLVGLELKRGYLRGPLSTFSSVALPAVAAIGGMLIPAFIYVMINRNHPVTLIGWSIPVATDIAFALGVLSLCGSRIPKALRLFLLTLAIFDDLGAILIITFFYSATLTYMFLVLAAVLVGTLYLFNQMGVRFLAAYLTIGVGLWFCFLFGGIHPTVAGVILALTIPDAKTDQVSLLSQLDKALSPWVAFVILPLFALANAGISLHDITWAALTSTLVLGIAAGLFLGKQVGVFGFTWLMVRFKWASLPANTSWCALYGVALLCGIGFTMSLFLGTLSFQNNELYLAEVRLGVMIGSILSGITGAAVLLIKGDHP